MRFDFTPQNNASVAVISSYLRSPNKFHEHPLSQLAATIKF